MLTYLCGVIISRSQLQRYCILILVLREIIAFPLESRPSHLLISPTVFVGIGCRESLVCEFPQCVNVLKLNDCGENYLINLEHQRQWWGMT